MTNTVPYEKMLGELMSLLNGLERDAVSIDEISARLNDAYALVEALKSRVSEAEAKVEAVINARTARAPSPSE